MCSHGRTVTQKLSTKGLPTSCLFIIKFSSSYNNYHYIVQVQLDSLDGAIVSEGARERARARARDRARARARARAKDRQSQSKRQS